MNKPKFLRRTTAQRAVLQKTAAFLAVLILFQAVFTPVAMALTGGPSQPEVQGFQPIGASNMVDLFTGDFSYNIPLLDVGGYPINISYSSNSGMDTEASWVGLGWSLNPGVINRNLRGLPDDFQGDNIQKEYHVKEDKTIGVSGGASFEFFGFFGLSASLGVFNNTYTGYGIEAGLAPSLSISKGNSDNASAIGGSVGVGLNYNSQSGLNVQPNIGLFHRGRKGFQTSYGLSASYNSIRGLKGMTMSVSMKNKEKNRDRNTLGSGRLSSNFTFGDFTYFPTSALPLRNSGFTFHASVGAEAFGAHPGGQVNGYVTTQKLVSPFSNQPAYGYLYSQEGQEISHSLQDFNREKDLAFRERNPILPLTYGTYDIFAASGQGVSGQFRTMRNDIGIFREAATQNLSSTTDIGLEVGAGNAFHAGADIIESNSTTTKGAWSVNNNMLPRMPFTTSENIYEASYMKSSGEKIITDLDFFDRIGGSDPINVQLQRTGSTSRANATFVSSKNAQTTGTVAVGSTLQRSKTVREKRNQVMSYLTAQEAALVGLDKQIKSYPMNNWVLESCDDSSIQTTSRTGGIRKDHHISEITITQPDGSRYVYGIPVYNTLQEEVSFNLGNVTSGMLMGETLVDYIEGTDNTTNNRKGVDHFFDKQKIAPYAHAYLLTAVLSPDYVDRTGDGVSDDDLGNATKLNYSRIYDDSNPYHWRSPYEDARYQEGSKAKIGQNSDDKGSYVYGNKEVWYLHSIESRTMLAQFHISDRVDGRGVMNENGGYDASQVLKRLDKIDLFTKAELIEDLSSMTLAMNPMPIKTVHFAYNAELCKGVRNNSFYGSSNDDNRGKLTLQKIWFTYQNSNRGSLNAYHFDYATNLSGAANASYNPDYDIDHYDRWGSYKKTPTSGTNAANDNYPSYGTSFPNNSDFPYVLQDKTLADEYAHAWNLTQIELPSGSTIHVEYEADDYAYIQNKRAGQMFFLKGFADSPTGAVNGNLFETTDNPKDYLVFDLAEPLTALSATDTEEFKRRYLEDVEQIYFHCLVDLDGSGKEDYIKGYLDYDISDITLRNDDAASGYDAVAIKITDFPIVKNNAYHPISYSTLQNLRLYYPEIIFPNYNLDNGSPETVIRTLLSVGDDFKNLFKGFMRNSINKGWAKEVTVNKSWVRLANPNFKKLGGGSRVKSVSVSDGWEATWNAVKGTNTAADKDSFYGQEYSYETEISIGGVATTVSSGVASYEPMIGNEENPFRQAIEYTEQASKTVDNELFVEKPIGEALFPSPLVGYSKVKVTPFGRYNNKTVQDAGYSINEFYTAKDFPVRTDYSRVNPPVKVETDPLLKFFRINVKEHMAASQGFVVEINDMHGKPRSEASYDKNASLLSSTLYKYQVEDENAVEKQLDNAVKVIQKDGTISTLNVGLEVDVWQDMREESNETEAAGVKTNVDGFLAFIVPIIGAVPFPTKHKESKSVRTAVTTKLIKRIGLLDEVIATENGSTISTKNELYDAQTGNVLLTRTQNEFDDAMYQFTYPAHWAYEGMEQAYQNIGAKAVAVIVNGKIQTPANYSYLTSGDEVFVESLAIGGDFVPLPDKYTIIKNQDNDLVLIDADGALLPFTQTLVYRLRVIRSGHRNQAGTAIGAIASRQAPLNTGQTALEINTTKEILEASATEFSDEWGMDCSYTYLCDDGGLVSDTINPYQEGAWGNWRAQNARVFHTYRSPASVTGVANTVESIQRAGAYNYFTPLWNYASGEWSVNAVNDWVMAQEMTVYDNRGNELENEDAIGNYSTAIFGYNQTRAKAIASNAQSREVLYDGFEDYNFDNDCNIVNNADFSIYDPTQTSLSTVAAHSGRYALEIGALSETKVSTNLDNCDVYVPTTITADTPIKNAWTDNTKSYIVNKCNTCIPTFKPQKGESYFITLWVATPTSIDCGKAPSEGSVAVYFDTESDLFFLEPEEAIIDGWQRMAGIFTVPTQASQIHIGLFNDANEALYVDDFRIHPRNANMVSYVYDPQSLRLMAQLDDNNYASFYEYDDEGILIRTKRETERGIVTIQEARTVLKSNN